MNIHEILILNLFLSAALLAATFGLLVIPVRRFELRIWRNLRIGKLRRWITKRRGVDEPLHPANTIETARKNILWHLGFTGLFSWQTAWAALSDGAWWRPLALPLVFLCLIYFLGSLVQRQKIAIVRLRTQESGRGSLRSQF